MFWPASGVANVPDGQPADPRRARFRAIASAATVLAAVRGARDAGGSIAVVQNARAVSLQMLKNYPYEVLVLVLQYCLYS